MSEYATVSNDFNSGVNSLASSLINLGKARRDVRDAWSGAGSSGASKDAPPPPPARAGIPPWAIVVGIGLAIYLIRQ